MSKGMSEWCGNGGKCTLPGHEGRVCDRRECRWYLPTGHQCKDCQLAAACVSFESVDETNQLTLDFEQTDGEQD